MKRRRDGCQLL